MSTLFALSDQAGARVNAVAAQEGVAPNVILEKLISEYLPPIAEVNETDEFGGKTFGDIFGDLIGAVDGGPSDMARHPEKYLRGFGETNNGSISTP